MSDWREPTLQLEDGERIPAMGPGLRARMPKLAKMYTRPDYATWAARAVLLVCVGSWLYWWAL